MTLTPSEIRYIMVLMGDHSHGSLIRPNDWFSGKDVLALREKLKVAFSAVHVDCSPGQYLDDSDTPFTIKPFTVSEA